jgi:hypothetical protein
MHWGWVLLLQFVTGGLFGAVWMLIIARWVKRVSGRSVAYGWAWVYVVVATVSLTATLCARADDWVNGATAILYFVVAFLLQGDLEEKPIALQLSGVMTFFFAPIYFQYHLQTFGLSERELSITG